VYLRRVKPPIPAAARVAAGHAAAHDLSPDAEPCGGCYVAQDAPQGVQVTHCRTGREQTFEVAVERIGGARLEIRVASAGGGPVARLGLPDLPERYRRPIIAALRAELVERALAPDERASLAAGDEDLLHVATRGLLRATAALEQDRSSRAIAAVTDLADLLDLQGGHIPFDVQTTFARIRAALPAKQVAELAPVASRLGFAEGH
jgi:hypothetical protein